MDDEENSLGCLGSIILIIISIIVVLFVGNKIYENYLHGEKKPFWKGTEKIQVCKTPYYSDEECYKLNVSLINNKTAQIHFNNGGYKYTYDLTCYFAAKFDDSPRYVFCRSWDSERQQWDFAPIWAHY